MHGINKVWDSLRAEPGHADPPAESENELVCYREHPKMHFDMRLHSDVKQLLKTQDEADLLHARHQSKRWGLNVLIRTSRKLTTLTQLCLVHLIQLEYGRINLVTHQMSCKYGTLWSWMQLALSSVLWTWTFQSAWWCDSSRQVCLPRNKGDLNTIIFQDSGLFA